MDEDHMRILIGTVGLAFLAGCVSTSDLEEKGPALDVTSTKSAKDYSRCLTPKWQDLNARVASTETESGYRIRLDIDMVGTPVMALVNDSAEGAGVRVFTRNSTWSNWVNEARSCL
ncbi:hypothetical protein KC131_25995 [Pseudomonas sp. JQ170]|uniref:hypothetical protein n=1 Tax=unclassified Pseudomonas TaxID=196821 RepID=UPI00264F846F|nr:MULTISPECIES: hypothetical protein [unclassified Pseudomonas]MDN7144102.1 hypothetical protein [Pseudomonas sp. JQ170]WRO74179.1 hypothetical protein U9R80_16810 [Pseudomonas sp. 170C]